MGPLLQAGTYSDKTNIKFLSRDNVQTDLKISFWNSSDLIRITENMLILLISVVLQLKFRNITACLQ